MPPELEAELAELIRQGKKVSADKRLRVATGVNLAVTKQWVDDYIAAHYPKRK